jgi:polysaccharide export outer membrane protein
MRHGLGWSRTLHGVAFDGSDIEQRRAKLNCAAGIQREALTHGRVEPASAMTRSHMGARAKRVVAVGLGLLACLVGPADAQERVVRPAVRASAPPPSGYLIGLGDVLRITVWKEPELTLDVTVRLDGMITVPLLGDVQAAGRVPSQLAGNLATELQRFIENPRVTVTVTQATSARIYVVGQMVRPGEFPLSGRMTVLKALALAGGFKEFAKPESIVIVREDQKVIPFNYKHVGEGKVMSQNILLAAGDTIIVP